MVDRRLFIIVLENYLIAKAVEHFVVDLLNASAVAAKKEFVFMFC